ncbi:unnamed protein product [Pylaiella littoralis]
MDMSFPRFPNFELCGEGDFARTGDRQTCRQVDVNLRYHGARYHTQEAGLSSASERSGRRRLQHLFCQRRRQRRRRCHHKIYISVLVETVRWHPPHGSVQSEKRKKRPSRTSCDAKTRTMLPLPVLRELHSFFVLFFPLAPPLLFCFSSGPGGGGGEAAFGQKARQGTY